MSLEHAREPRRRAFRPGEAAEMLGCKKTKIYGMMKSGELRSVKVGGLRLIPETAIDQLLAVGDEAG
jgi:excisionase family DNA binding protein